MENRDPVIEDVKQRIDTKIYGLRRFRYPGLSKDTLYSHDSSSDRPDSSGDPLGDALPPRVTVHKGNIASGELIIKNAQLRDQLAKEYNILCFEMEAAGALSDFPVLAIRGISDYCDWHKSDEWHGYAAAAAAAYARNLFNYLPKDSITNTTSDEQKKLLEHRRQDLLSSLNFRSIGLGRNNIDDPHEETCQWIFRTKNEMPDDRHWDDFDEWLRTGSGIYWIQGKAGAGKSVLMNYIYNHDSTHAFLKEWSTGAPVQAPCFFFWASGHEVQRSSEGLLRSILYQVIKNDGSINAETISPHNPPHNSMWNEVTLRKLFINVLESTRSSQICFFIDGLDEFNGDWISLVRMFHRATQYPGIKICVSSRPENVFVECFHRNPNLKVEDFTYRDMEHYICDMFSSFPLIQNSGSQYSEEISWIVASVADKAGGVWQWTKFAVSSLINGNVNCDSLKELDARLSELPDDLKKLYANMLERVEPRYQLLSKNILLTVSLLSFFDFDLPAPAFHLFIIAFMDFPLEKVESWESWTRQELFRKLRRIKTRWNAATMGLVEFSDQVEEYNDSGYEDRPDIQTFILVDEYSSMTVNFAHRTISTFIAEHCSMLLTQSEKRSQTIEIAKGLSRFALWMYKNTYFDYSEVRPPTRMKTICMQLVHFIRACYEEDEGFEDQNLDELLRNIDHFHTPSIIDPVSAIYRHHYFLSCYHGPLLPPRSWYGSIDWMGYLASEGMRNYIISHFDAYEGPRTRTPVGKSTHLLACILNLLSTKGQSIYKCTSLIRFLLNQGANITQPLIASDVSQPTCWDRFLFCTANRHLIKTSISDKVLVSMAAACPQVMMENSAAISSKVLVIRPFQVTERCSIHSHMTAFTKLVIVFEVTFLPALYASFTTEMENEIAWTALLRVLRQIQAPLKAEFIGFRFYRDLRFARSLPGGPTFQLSEKDLSIQLERYWKTEWTQQLFQSKSKEEWYSEMARSRTKFDALLYEDGLVLSQSFGKLYLRKIS